MVLTAFIYLASSEIFPLIFEAIDLKGKVIFNPFAFGLVKKSDTKLLKLSFSTLYA